MKKKRRITQFQIYVPVKTRMLLLKALIVGVFLGLLPAQAYAITDAEGIQCIMGEARNQPYSCQVAIGEALRNRGTTQGVYGCKVAVIEPQRVWRKAERAWAESKTSKLVNGSSFWESSDFKKPYWANSMTETARVGKHIFYRK